MKRTIKQNNIEVAWHFSIHVNGLQVPHRSPGAFFVPQKARTIEGKCSMTLQCFHRLGPCKRLQSIARDVCGIDTTCGLCTLGSVASLNHRLTHQVTSRTPVLPLLGTAPPNHRIGVCLSPRRRAPLWRELSVGRRGTRRGVLVGR